MRRNDDGYTVLEALVAFAILSVVLVSLYGAAGTSLNLIDKASQLSTTAMLAQSKLDEIDASPVPLPAREQGTFAGSDIQWHAEATTIPDGRDAHSPRVLQEVRLTLSWPGGLTRSTYTVVTRHLGTIRP